MAMLMHLIRSSPAACAFPTVTLWARAIPDTGDRTALCVVHARRSAVERGRHLAG